VSEYTSGPWQWIQNETEQGLDGDSQLVSKSGEAILTLGDCYPNGGEPNSANACLIAVAPDLLNSLNSLLLAYEKLRIDEWSRPRDQWDEESDGEALQAIELIAKIRGES
jgi:hypothetical protein